MRKVPFITGQFYHICNRGVDKRPIFNDKDDLQRFFQSMEEFNVVEPIGSIFLNSWRRKKNALDVGRLNVLRRPTSKAQTKPEKLVQFICYCLNPNHFHFLLEQIVDGGLSEFMKRIGGYTKYFNERYKRNGSLFQGRFRSTHIDSNAYLLHVSAYINLNYRVHRLPPEALGLVKSSLQEYTTGLKDGFCKKDIVLGQFKNPRDYMNYAEEALEGILARRSDDEDEIHRLLIE